MLDFGEITGYDCGDGKITVFFEKGTGYLFVIDKSIINVYVNMSGRERRSKAIEGDKLKPASVSAGMDGERLLVETAELRAVVRKDFAVDFYTVGGELLSEEQPELGEVKERLSDEAKKLLFWEGHAVEEDYDQGFCVCRGLSEGESFYALGDKTGFLDKRGYDYVMWNTDDPAPQVECFKSLYKSVPFLIYQKKDRCCGFFFDNTFRSKFDLGKQNPEQWSYSAQKGDLDYYFISGDMKEVVGGYTYLTGRAPLPQLWTLGYHQSRWSYKNEAELREVARSMREKGVPCDALHLDIDYMDGYRVFTWDKKSFPDPKAMIGSLAGDGFKVVTIVDPGVKRDKGYSVYDEGESGGYFAKDPETGGTYVNVVWPGEAVFPDFGRAEVRRWWGEKHSALTNAGVRGVWDDMNEPASFRGQLSPDVVMHDEERVSDHAEQHNVYGHNMAKATFEGLKKLDGRRPFVITRACYSGTQKYSIVWTGDNHSIWTHLQMAIPQLCNLGLSGYALAGTDVGGFSSDTTPELLARWVQVGCFSTFFRNHYANHARRQEPWQFGGRILSIYRDFVKLRYRLIPLFYDLMFICERTGLPPLRPLVLNYERDETVRNMNDQFMLGDDMLVSPVVEPGAVKKLCYLPEGEWYDYFSGEKHMGGYLIKDAPLEKCPVFVRAGAIIPNYPEQSYIGEKDTGETLLLELFPGNGKARHFADDGESYAYRDGVYNEYELVSARREGEQRLRINMIHAGYDKAYKYVSVKFMGECRTVPMNDGSELSFSIDR